MNANKEVTLSHQYVNVSMQDMGCVCVHIIEILHRKKSSLSKRFHPPASEIFLQIMMGKKISLALQACFIQENEYPIRNAVCGLKYAEAIMCSIDDKYRSYSSEAKTVPFIEICAKQLPTEHSGGRSTIGIST